MNEKLYHQRVRTLKEGKTDVEPAVHFPVSPTFISLVMFWNMDAMRLQASLSLAMPSSNCRVIGSMFALSVVRPFQNESAVTYQVNRVVRRY